MGWGEELFVQAWLWGSREGEFYGLCFEGQMELPAKPLAKAMRNAFRRSFGGWP